MPFLIVMFEQTSINNSFFSSNVPFCAEEILADAKKCKHCGEFLNEKATVIEQTSKRYKKLMLVGVLFGLLGIFLFVVSIGKGSSSFALTGALSIFVGMTTYLYARYKAWWYHG